MGWLKKLAGFEAFNAKDMFEKVKDNPARLLYGAGDEFGTKLWNGVLGRDDEEIVNRWGGAADGAYERAEAEGIDTGPGRTGHQIAEAIAAFYAGKAATNALGMGGNAASSAPNLNATNPALIDSAMGATGYGASSAGAGGGGASGLSGLLGSGSGGMNWTDWGKLALQAYGAYQGSKDAKDQTQTQTRDPWGPAQPYILANLQRGQQLQDQLAANPFTPQQQTAYNNIGGLLNLMNQNAPGLLGGYQANATGANNYDRSNPRKALTGSTAMQGNWAPGLLNFFPPRG